MGQNGNIKKSIKKILIDLSKQSDLFRLLFRKARFIKNRLRYTVFYFSNIDDKAIVFESFLGRSYSDNPRAIYEYMINNNTYKEYTFIWAFKDTDKYSEYSILNNERTHIVKYGSFRYYRAYGSSKFWISNSRIPEAIYKKRNQVYVQCWHGTPLKKLGYDIQVEGKNALNTNRNIREKYRSDAKRYSFMLSSSEFCTEKFTTAFNLKAYGKECVIIEEGFPRNDILLNYEEKDVKKIRCRLGIPEEKRIILYAPTWRDNQHESGKGYVYTNKLNFDKLKESLSESYVVLFRAHYFVANKFDFDKYKGFVYDVSDYDDIGELYIISDILITDYSSVFFDYAILKRPIIFYMYDLKEYEEEIRGFYISLDKLPGEVCVSEEALIDNIFAIQRGKITLEYKAFNNKYNYLDDGHTTERVVKTIFLDTHV